MFWQQYLRQGVLQKELELLLSPSQLDSPPSFLSMPSLLSLDVANPSLLYFCRIVERLFTSRPLPFSKFVPSPSASTSALLPR